MRQSGFSVLSIDHESNGASVPIVTLDLTSESGQKILWDVLASPNLLGVHYIGKRRKHDGPAHVEHLEQTAQEELDMGFMEGPFVSEREVTEHLGHSNWMVIRRFVLVQGAELKLRPIDDCLEAQLNRGFTSTSYLKLQDIDYVVGLSLRIAEAVVSGKQKHGTGNWHGKCLDLSKAYKQLAVHPRHRHLAVIFYHDKNH